MKRRQQDAEEQIIWWLTERGYCVWRCNLGGLRKGANPMAGFPHIGAVHRQLHGRLLGVIVRKTGAIVSEAQRAWHRALAGEGALIVVAAGTLELERALQAARTSAPIARDGPDPLVRTWGERDEF